MESEYRRAQSLDTEELLFRESVLETDPVVAAYYHDKVVMITGGGGSIGSELCRQIAKMKPKCLVVVDICENGAYLIQKELEMLYRNAPKVVVKIVSVCDRQGMERVFREFCPQILFHAAAHKHVALMESNCCEAVKNNVFGTNTTVLLAEKYGVERFVLISTDKAVNPKSMMGATKRMCEMIVQAHSAQKSGTVYSTVRFGNVLGSAGSVIPLFEKQILQGGPVTLTDRRAVRYLMTIPEAGSLLLQAGAMAKQSELFVLDMGKPVQILELAERLIRLMGYEPHTDIPIVETGLLPGEKLCEELFVQEETLKKTVHRRIFIVRDTALSLKALEEKLSALEAALSTNDDEEMRRAMHKAVPTFRASEPADKPTEIEILHAE